MHTAITREYDDTIANNTLILSNSAVTNYIIIKADCFIREY